MLSSTFVDIYIYSCIRLIYSTDHWEQYIAAVKTLLNRKWERLSEHLVRKVQTENVWVSLRLTSRGRDRPDQTPASADRGSRTPGDNKRKKTTNKLFFGGCGI